MSEWLIKDHGRSDFVDLSWMVTSPKIADRALHSLLQFGMAFSDVSADAFTPHTAKIVLGTLTKKDVQYGVTSVPIPFDAGCLPMVVYNDGEHYLVKTENTLGDGTKITGLRALSYHIPFLGMHSELRPASQRICRHLTDEGCGFRCYHKTLQSAGIALASPVPENTMAEADDDDDVVILESPPKRQRTESKQSSA